MTHDMADKTTHVDIVQNPDIKSFLDECNYMVPPTGNELAEIVSNFISVPFWDKALPTKIIAIDGSNYEATVNPQIPFTRFGFVKIGHLLINRDSYKGLNCGKFIDPFAVARLSEDNSSLLFSFPSSNMTYKEQKSVRNSFRLSLFYPQPAVLCIENMAGRTCYAAAGTLPLPPQNHQLLQPEVLPRATDRYDEGS